MRAAYSEDPQGKLCTQIETVWSYDIASQYVVCTHTCIYVCIGRYVCKYVGKYVGMLW